MKIEIKDKQTLVNAVGYIHDSGFNNEDVKYDSVKRTFTIVSKEYEFKGRFIQRKTNNITAICNLTLQNIKSCNIKFVNKTNESGYNTIGEDYFNTIEIKGNKIILITTFQRIELEADNFIGWLERVQCLR